MMIVGLPKFAPRPSNRLNPRQRARITAVLRSAYRRHGRGKYILAALKRCLP
jgi:hypothetical protein